MKKTIMKLELLMIPLISVFFFNGCTSVNEDRYAQNIENDVFGDASEKIKYLNQGWSHEEAMQFYFTTQGSNLMPYSLFLNLESSQSHTDDQFLFRSERNFKKYRYLLQKSDEKYNPDGLPVGFVKDDFDGIEYIGLTCAACHTNQINYQGIGLRIDGAPTTANIQLMFVELEEALESTHLDLEKKQRLSKKMKLSLEETNEVVNNTYDKIQYYNQMNLSVNNGKEILYGYARLDAFGRIYNQILHAMSPGASPGSFNSPNAPVSYPFLWDTPQHDFVQWNGIGDNGSSTPKAQTGPIGKKCW